MIKNIIIKLLIILFILAIGYSIFWFFKAGQVEKQINDIISENNSYFSVSSIEVKGFPFKQKVIITDFKIAAANSFLKNYQINFKEIEADSSIFGSKFKAKINQETTLTNILDGSIATLEFNAQPEILFSVEKSMLANFSYKDQGFKILDANKSELFSATSSEVDLSSTLSEDEKIINKISINLKEISKFDLFDIYKNSYEQKIIDGLKIGEIVLNNQIIDNANQIAEKKSETSVNLDNQQAVNHSDNKNNIKPNAQDNAKADENNKISAQDAIQNAANEKMATNNADVNVEKKIENNSETAQLDIAQTIKKINLTANFEYVLTPQKQDSPQVENQENGQENVDPSAAIDPAIENLQTQESPIQYSKTLKINNLDFDNGDYRLSLIGQIDFFQDDTLPSGAITIKVEKISQLISHFGKKFSDNAEARKNETSAVQISDLNLVDNNKNLAQEAQNISNLEPENKDMVNAENAKMAANGKEKTKEETKENLVNSNIEQVVVSNSESQLEINNNDPYYIFLKRLSANLENVVSEISVKNQLSKDEVAVFEIRREKNLEFLINETSMREIVGKF